MPDTVRHPWAVVAIAAASLAAWMGMGTLHDFQHADSLLTVLVSTQKWTPFFWGQDRFGMLVPLVAMPIRHPLGNLLAQGWMMTAAALVAPFVVARFLVGRAGGWLAIGACADTLFLLVATPAVQFDWLVTQPYALSITLGFAALIVAEDRDRPMDTIAAIGLLLLACWVNVGIVVMLAIGTAARVTRPVRLLALEGAAAAAASAAARFLASAHTVASLAPPGQWPDGWWQLLEGTSAITASPLAAAGIAAAAAAALLWLGNARRLPSWRVAVAIVGMAAGTWLVVGASLWVGMNRYAFRYMYPTVMIVGVGVSTILMAPFEKRPNRASIAAVAALAAVTIVGYGTPSFGRVDRGVDDRFGRQTAAVLHSGATVIGGDYWRVWPAVFHANLALARAHAKARVFGLAYRSEATDPLWQRAGRQVLIAGWPDDRSFGAVAAEHGLAVTPFAHLPDIDLYRGQP